MVTAALLIHAIILEIFTSDSDALADMSDLGTLMLGGFILAVVAAVALTIVRLRIIEKKPERPNSFLLTHETTSKSGGHGELFSHPFCNRLLQLVQMTSEKVIRSRDDLQLNVSNLSQLTCQLLDLSRRSKLILRTVNK